MKKKLIIFTLIFVLLSINTVPVFAKTVKNPTTVTLKPGKTYKSYDITGDKKPDKIKIVLTTEWGEGTGCKVIINGKTCYKLEDSFFFWDDARIHTLKNGAPFLELSLGCDDVGVVQGLFQYKSGKLKQVADFSKYYNGYVRKVKNNSIYTSYTMNNPTVGASSISIRYDYKKGTLKKSGNTHSFLSMNGDGKDENIFYTGKKLTAYKSATSKKKAFTVPANKGVEVVKIYLNGNTERYKIKYKNQYGWINASKEYYYPDYSTKAPVFTNPLYAG